MRKEVIKEKISWYKLLFTLLSTALVACIGWLVANLDFPVKGVIFLNGLAIATISVGMSFIIYKIRYYLKKLGELND
ncbi:hypothetical protein IJ732_00855 [bacterium]|nr:hypothetical protein [bacterium]